MSQENVQIIRALSDAFNRRDYKAVLNAMDPEVEWHPPPDIPNAAVAIGREALIANFQDWFGAWEDYRAEPEEVLDGGDDTVVLCARESARGKGSGIELRSRRIFGVFQLRNHKVVRQQAYLDRADALRAAGLSEENVELDRQNRDLEIIRELYSHWERGDFTYWEAFADDYVWKALDATEPGEYTGIAEGRAAWRAWLQAWDGFTIEAEEVIAGPDGRYVVMQLFRGKGKASGLESTNRSAAVATIQDRLIVRMEGFWDRDAALQAVGLGRR